MIATNRREIAASEYFSGMFETALEEGEVIVSVRFSKPDSACYKKFEQPASRFALVGVFLARLGSSARVAVTGASEAGVFRWAEAEEALNSNFATDAIEGLRVSPDGMISDIHGSSEYRAHLVSVLTRRAIGDAS